MSILAFPSTSITDSTSTGRSLVTAANAAAAATAAGVGTGDSPQFTAVNVGHASDTTITRSAAGVIAVEGVDVSLNSTSATHTAGTIELGAATDTTLSRSSAGVLAVEGVTVSLNSTSATHTAGTIELGAASDTTLSRSSAGVLAVEGVTVSLNSTSSTHTASTIELGHASDTTIARSAAGAITVEGATVLLATKEYSGKILGFSRVDTSEGTAATHSTAQELTTTQQISVTVSVDSTVIVTGMCNAANATAGNGGVVMVDPGTGTAVELGRTISDLGTGYFNGCCGSRSFSVTAAGSPHTFKLMFRSTGASQATFQHRSMLIQVQ